MPAVVISLFRTIWRVLPLLILFGLIETLWELWDPAESWSRRLSRPWLASSFLSFAVFRMEFLGLSASWPWTRLRNGGSAASRKPIGRYLLVSALLFYVPLALGIFAARMNPWIAGEAREELYAPIALTAAVVFTVTLATFGTLLPAAAEGRPFSPRSALLAARRKGLTVALQLVVFTGAHLVLGLVAMLKLANSGLLTDMTTPAKVLADTLTTAFGHIWDVIVAVVLLRAYRAAYPTD